MFKEELMRMVDLAGCSANALDKAIGRQNYVGRLGRGELPAPDKATAHALGEALRELGAPTSGEALWLFSAPERAEPDVRDYYEGLLGKGCEGLAAVRIENAQLRAENEELRGVLAAVHKALGRASPSDRHPPEDLPLGADDELADGQA